MPSLFALDWIHHFHMSTHHARQTGNVVLVVDRDDDTPAMRLSTVDWARHTRSTARYLRTYHDAQRDNEETIHRLTASALAVSDRPHDTIPASRLTLLVPGYLQSVIEWLSGELDRIMDLASATLPRACLVLYRMSTVRQGCDAFRPLFHTTRAWQDEEVPPAALKTYVLKRFKRSVYEEMYEELHGKDKMASLRDARAAVYRLTGALPFIDQRIRDKICRASRKEGPWFVPSSHIRVHTMDTMGKQKNTYDARIVPKLHRLKQMQFPHLTVASDPALWYATFTDAGRWFYTLADDGTVASMCYVKMGDHTWTVWDVATHPRFKRLGYGSAVVQAAIHRVPLNVTLELYIVAGRSNTLFLEQMYRALGFVSTDSDRARMLRMEYPSCG